jgi:hypothetical protein
MNWGGSTFKVSLGKKKKLARPHLNGKKVTRLT